MKCVTFGRESLVIGKWNFGWTVSRSLQLVTSAVTPSAETAALFSSLSRGFARNGGRLERWLED